MGFHMTAPDLLVECTRCSAEHDGPFFVISVEDDQIECLRCFVNHGIAGGAKETEIEATFGTGFLAEHLGNGWFDHTSKETG